jgi:hypothetical protein
LISIQGQKSEKNQEVEKNQSQARFTSALLHINPKRTKEPKE